MSTQILLKEFEEIYNQTYNKTLKYILCKCSNIDDVNDLLQDTYIELYKILKRKRKIKVENSLNYVIGIAKKQIQRHYGVLYKLKVYSTWGKVDEQEYEEEIPLDMDLEEDIIAELNAKLNAELVWRYIKKKGIKIIRIFYLYYYCELKISEIAKELKISESNVKNLLYRTQKEIKKNIKKEGDFDVF